MAVHRAQLQNDNFIISIFSIPVSIIRYSCCVVYWYWTTFRQCTFLGERLQNFCRSIYILFLLLLQITEDLNTDPESDSDHFMNVLIESLSLLGKIPEALEVHCPLKNRVIQSCI